jgi:hypothetical protein
MQIEDVEESGTRKEVFALGATDIDTETGKEIN